MNLLTLTSRCHILPYALLGTAVCFAIMIISREALNTHDWGTSFVSLALTLILAYQTHRNLQTQTLRATPNHRDSFASWICLSLAALLTLCCSSSYMHHLAMACLWIAAICFFNGILTVRKALTLIFWCTVFIPMRGELLVILSYPFRIIATVLSTEFLNLIGVHVINQATTMRLPGQAIAVTYACSGIQQLDIFLVLAYLTVRRMQPTTYWRLVHFAFIPLVIIIANTLRLITTVLLYLAIGNMALNPLCHTLLGIAQVILGLLIYYLLGLFLASIANAKKEAIACS